VVPEIANADRLEISSSSLLNNIQIDPVTYEAMVENGKPATYGIPNPFQSERLSRK
jgi:hypothetical protein